MNIKQTEQNRCRELGVLPKFHSKAFLEIHVYPSADDFEGKKRLRRSRSLCHCFVISGFSRKTNFAYK